MSDLRLQCPKCGTLSPVDEEDLDLIPKRGRILVTCAECNTDFVGEPDKLWTFYGLTRASIT